MRKTLLFVSAVCTLFACKKSSDTTVTPAHPTTAGTTIDTSNTTTFILDTSKYIGDNLNGTTIAYCSPNNLEIDSVSNTGGFGGRYTGAWAHIGGSIYRIDLPTYIAFDTAHWGKGGYLIGVPYTSTTGHRLADEALKMMVIVNRDTTYNQL